MNAAATKLVQEAASASLDSSVRFYGIDEQVDVSAHLRDGSTWVKVYAPSEEAERDILEEYLVMIDIGARTVEPARAVSSAVRDSMRGSRRHPGNFRLVRLVMLTDEGFIRFQQTYRMLVRPVQAPGEPAAED